METKKQLLIYCVIVMFLGLGVWFYAGFQETNLSCVNICSLYPQMCWLKTVAGIITVLGTVGATIILISSTGEKKLEL